MAKRRRAGGLVGKLGTAGKKGVAAHKSDETTFDTGASLPAGIEGGIAQLTECKFDIFKTGEFEGEYYFLAAGIVKQPLEHNGVPIEGLRTQIGPEAMCDTPKRERRPDVDSHIDWVLNELRKLGVDTGELDIDSLEDAAAALKEEQPHFRFRTWKGQPTEQYPNPRVNDVWSGICDYEDDEEGNDVVDATGEAESEEEEAEGSTLTSLGEAADEGDETAEATLSEKAEEVGLDANDFATWAEVATAIEEAPEEGNEESEEGNDDGDDDEEEEEEGDDFLPVKEEVFDYKPPRKRKAIQCEVLAVFPRKKTCNLKSLDDSKVYKGVPFGKLESDEE